MGPKVSFRGYINPANSCIRYILAFLWLGACGDVSGFTCGSQQSASPVVPQGPCTCFFETASLIRMWRGSQVRLSWMTSEPQGQLACTSSVLKLQACTSSVLKLQACTSTPSVCKNARVKPRFPCLRSKHCTNGAVSQASRLLLKRKQAQNSESIYDLNLGFP